MAALGRLTSRNLPISLGDLCAEGDADAAVVRAKTLRCERGPGLFRCRAAVEVRAEDFESALQVLHSFTKNFDDILVETLNLDE